MHKYIALLRGINVSGHHLIKMEQLKQLFLDAGFLNISTYIQSGNVIFSSLENDISTIKKIITNAIEQEFNFKICVVVILKSELEIIFKSHPFLNIDNMDLKKVAVTFFESSPKKEDFIKITSLITKGESILYYNNVVYLYCVNGFGKTKLTNNNIEAKLKVSATTRNWNTVTKLYQLSH